MSRFRLFLCALFGHAPESKGTTLFCFTCGQRMTWDRDREEWRVDVQS